jgi:transcriptional regulator with XRE-family HTH domain/tetratricopeptide (TPR) repeat protein
MTSPHPASCARRIRLVAEQQGWPLDKTADEIHRHCKVHLLRAHRLARGWTLIDVVERAQKESIEAGEPLPTMTHQRLSSWENGSDTPTPRYLDALCRLYRSRPDRLGFGRDYSTSETPYSASDDASAELGNDTSENSTMLLWRPPEGADSMNRRQLIGLTAAVTGTGLPPTLLQVIEQIRLQADSALSSSSVGAHVVDQLEQRATDYGYAYRTKPAAVLLHELAMDFVEVRLLTGQPQPLDQQRRLYGLITQFGGLLALTLKNLGRFTEARRWFTTAQLAASETGDRQLRAWVIAKDAILAIDSDMPPEAVIERARHAQAVAGSNPSAGKLIAVTMEARALGMQGRAVEVEAKRREAEAIFDKLGPTAVNSSAFAMSEQQMHFYLGNAFRLAGNMRSALPHWDRALALYPANEVQDPALIKLDGAAAMVKSGEIDAGCDQASEVLLSLPAENRVALVLRWADGVTQAVPHRIRNHASVRRLRELATMSTGDASASARTLKLA